jgi:GTP-binding protein YchF
MSLQIGIVGLPNVGKSTLFNALTKTQAAQAANYPFCTIDPNVGIVEVPDKRLDALSKIVNPERVLPAAIEFVDIAGLVKGASEGEGLGNKFLSHIRQVDAIAQVVRIFEDDDIIHVHGKIDPKGDREIIEAELVLADIQTVQKRFDKAKSESKAGDKEKAAYAELVGGLLEHLLNGGLARDFTDDELVLEKLHDLHLLTIKPILYIVNMKEHEIGSFDAAKVRGLLGVSEQTPVVGICAKLEEELIGFTDEEAAEFLGEHGLTEPGLHTLIQEAYKILGLQTYFTAGVQEVRAWTVKVGATAPQAAGVIHTDFEKGFIKAEVVGYEDFIAGGGEAGAKAVGKLRIEGKEYIVKDGDVMHFRFNN